MLLSYRHSYLFVHIAKTGGSSIRKVLRRQRMLDPMTLPMALCSRLNHAYGHRLAAKLPRHAPVSTAQEMLPVDEFHTLWKFAFVRNPWDRMVSAYGHFVRERQDILTAQHITSFGEFADWLISSHHTYTGDRCTLVRAVGRPQVEYVQDLHGRVSVDFLGRFESLASDMQLVFRKLGIACRSIPHQRNGKRTTDYRQNYSDTLADRIAQAYQSDIACFGYTFDPEPSHASANTYQQIDDKQSSVNVITERETTYVEPIADLR